MMRWVGARGDRDGRRRSGRSRLDFRHSLRNRFTLVIFAITLLAIAALYLYVAPGLRTRLVNERLNDLLAAARAHSGEIIRTVGSNEPRQVVRGTVNAAALRSGDR